jgi:hypothetical protein
MSTAAKIGVVLIVLAIVTAVWLIWLGCEWAARQVAS